MMNAEQAPTSEVAESNIQQVLNDSGECTGMFSMVSTMYIYIYIYTLASTEIIH